MHYFHLKNEKQKQRRSKTVHVTIVLLIHSTVSGDATGIGRGRRCRPAGMVWDGDNSCGNRVETWTKSENLAGTGWG